MSRHGQEFGEGTGNREPSAISVQLEISMPNFTLGGCVEWSDRENDLIHDIAGTLVWTSAIRIKQSSTASDESLAHAPNCRVYLACYDLRTCWHRLDCRSVILSLSQLRIRKQLFLEECLEMFSSGRDDAECCYSAGSYGPDRFKPCF